MAHLITGYAGSEHIQSSDQGSFNAAFFGQGQFVMSIGNKLKATITSNNSIRISDGDLLMHGRHIRINPGTYEDLTIQNGSTGKKRIDLVVMTYEKNASTGVETAYLEVIKGTETTGTAVEPSYIAGNILDGAIKNQMPLYALNLDGISLSGSKQKFTVCPTYKELAEKYEQEFITSCNNHLDSLNILDSSNAIKNNTTSNQMAGGLGVKALYNELNTAIGGKAASNHTHTKSQITDFAHNHDERYFTETEIKSMFNSLFVTWECKHNFGNVPANTGVAYATDTAWSGKKVLGVVGVRSELPVTAYVNSEGNLNIDYYNYSSSQKNLGEVAVTVLYANNQ